VTGSRWIVPSFLLVGLFLDTANAYQGKSSEGLPAKSVGEPLELSTRGEVRLMGGRRGAFRIYTAPDGTQGWVTFGQFSTVNDAQRQVSEWSGHIRVITRERKKDKGGRLTGDRILATPQASKSKAKGFLIIRRDDTRCYLIDSLSLTVALQLEKMTE